jgi:hypothetical protein
VIVTEAASPNQRLHLTGAATLVSRDTKLLQRPRQVSLVGSALGSEPDARTFRGIITSWLQMSRAAYLSRAARTRFALPCAGRLSRIASVVRTRRRPTAAA